MLAMGKPAPDFEAPGTGDKNISLSSFRGKTVVFYFYPKDNTPGCTKEGEGFRDQYADFQAANCEILGCSRDSVKSHENFKTKYHFPFDLVSDKEETVCGLYDVIKEKNMYGKKVMGVERSTFVIDKDGNLAKEWRKVKVNGHVEEVLAFVQSL